MTERPERDDAGVTIETPRLLLRDFAEGDEASVAAYHEDPRSAEFYGPQETGAAFARALVARFRAWAAERPRRNHQLAIVERGAPRVVIGCVGLRTAGQPPGVADFGLELAPSCWGRGYATEAARAMLAFGTDTLELRQVRAETVSANTRVEGLLRTLGFERVAEREGDEWMRERGWRKVEWRLGG